MQRNILPILIGSTPAAARAMLRDFGGPLHVLDRKRGGLFWIHGIRFHRISGVERDILALQIKDICNQDLDRLAIIGASPEYRELLDRLAPEIESFCIILREDNLERCKALKNSGIDG